MTKLDVSKIGPIKSPSEVASAAVKGAMGQAMETGHGEVTITVNKEFKRIGTYHGVAKEIAGMTGHPDMEKEIMVMIKRLGHYEKLDVYSKMKEWLEMALMGSEDEKFTKERLLSAVKDVMGDIDLKCETHRELAGSEDCGLK